MEGTTEMTLHPVALRRKMRRGTHSCSECRRRKIKCRFQPGNTSTCIPCTARGSRCIDQRDAIHVNHSIPETEPVSIHGGGAGGFELERKENGQRVHYEPGLNFQGLNLGEPVSEADERAPFVSLLNDAEGTLGNGQLELPDLPTQSTLSRQPLPFPGSVTGDVCSRLRSALPNYDSLMSTLSKNGAWWNSFRHKTHAICQGPFEGLAAFAAHAYTSNIPAEVGMLVTAYARSTIENYHLYNLVENLILSDSSLSYSVEHMELILLLAKAYSDIGQPRQCWLMYRKGLGIAELMGLYKRETPSLRLKSIWWAFYHGDRFSSLLLGLPYGFNDAHYGPTVERSDDGPAVAEQKFLLRCAFIAGKVIDRNVMPGKPSSASSMLLDEQMDAIASSMPEAWWDLPDQLPNSDPEIDRLRDRLLQQYYFFHVRINLHLPFMARSAVTSTRDSHRLTCIEASRQLLRRFIILRTRVRGSSIFDCKTSDFVGFMAAVALLIGISSPNSDAILTPHSTSNEDRNLIMQVKGIFEREVKEISCKIASQCLGMLEMLSNNPVNGSDLPTGRALTKVAIPYFGLISRHATLPITPQSISSQKGDRRDVIPKDSNDISIHSVCNDGINDVGFELGNNDMVEIMETSAYWQFGSLESFQVDDLSSWLDTAMMDISQDWDVSPQGLHEDYCFS
ncbi:hypothetical protein BGZ63DRAFT_373209 [Mariannaea sp. PMI_226]|nr:hypothetical protein BGZ63DRAFT_373209 [Mariannaea sp. PMI_226]